MTMDWPLLLACLHHLVVFALVGVFAAEFTLMRPGLDGPRLRQLGRLDLVYGVLAVLIIVVGVIRVLVLGADYYLGNHAFWGKMGIFLIVGLLSAQPTLAIRRWLKASKGVPDYVPPAAEVALSRRFVHAQALGFALIPLFAAAMAQGYGA